MRPIPIQETFYTWQGEGVHTGRAAFFVRTYGCPVQCPWCDAAGTWHKDYRPDHILRVDAQMLADQAIQSGAKMCVITGGEPTIHEGIISLCDELAVSDIEAHLETSGTFTFQEENLTVEDIREMFQWVTVSPKVSHRPLRVWLEAAHELKLIIEKPEDIMFWLDYFISNTSGERKLIVRLHPEWTQRDNAAVLKAICEAVKSPVYGLDIRAGWQLHKLYRVDALDPRSANPVPLGGRLILGY